MKKVIIAFTILLSSIAFGQETRVCNVYTPQAQLPMMPGLCVQEALDGSGKQIACYCSKVFHKRTKSNKVISKKKH